MRLLLRKHILCVFCKGKQSVNRSIDRLTNWSTNHLIKPTNQPTNPSINQSVNQSIRQSINRSINQSVNRSTSQSVNQPINQSIDRSIDRPINQSINHTLCCKDPTTETVRFANQMLIMLPDGTKPLGFFGINPRAISQLTLNISILGISLKIDVTRFKNTAAGANELIISVTQWLRHGTLGQSSRGDSYHGDGGRAESADSTTGEDFVWRSYGC